MKKRSKVKKKHMGDKTTKKNLKFIDLFSGIGGIRLGFERNGFDCVFSSEIDSECQKTYFLNFGEYPKGDITKINGKKIPNHDVLTAGFPCQPFSISGRQKGFQDVRGTLFFNILKIIKEKQPKVVFLENVKHLKNHDNGRTLKVILDGLQKLGYKTKWKILNAKDFGTAQNRERIIIIGNKEKEFDFSKLKYAPKVVLKDILQEEGNFEYMDEKDYTLIKHPKIQDSGLIFVGYRNKAIRTKGVRNNTLHLSRVHKQPNRIYSSEGTHPTIPSQESAGRFFVLHKGRVRKLTIDECFALMGFPEKFKRFSTNGRLYQQIGNSVCVPMMDALAKEIINQYF
jgi:DNA (cytosine-5)-methyltransferase 1